MNQALDACSGRRPVYPCSKWPCGHGGGIDIGCADMSASWAALGYRTTFHSGNRYCVGVNEVSAH
jgi:hypothetical protein